MNKIFNKKIDHFLQLAIKHSNNLFGATYARSLLSSITLFLLGLVVSFIIANGLAKNERQEKREAFSNEAQTKINFARSEIAKNEGSFDLTSRLMGQLEVSSIQVSPELKKLLVDSGYVCLIRIEV